ncbi:MAG: sensor histidine kinase [Oscillospiraceae bacterium]|nr:sensor histidine kinase [Oscillospiraceae bacterium]
MMTELSLNVLDVAQNSVKAKASLIEISVRSDFEKDLMTIVIADNGCGMDEQQLAAVCDPFYTTRTTRKVGLGVSFFKLAAESAGGEFSITSEKGVGTTVTASFQISNIDRMPLGDMTATMHSLITLNADIDFVYNYRVDDKEFTLDTREFREILEGVPFDVPEVSQYIKEYLSSNKEEVDSGKIL